MAQYQQFMHKWRPAPVRTLSETFVQLFPLKTNFGYCVMLTELEGNPGMSVTNGIEPLIETLIEKDHSLANLGHLWIEHYYHPLKLDTFDEVRFDFINGRVRKADWKRTTWLDVSSKITKFDQPSWIEYTKILNNGGVPWE